MQMRREDYDEAMTREIEDPRCLHGARIGVIPTPEGPMFVLRTVDHGDPGPDTSATEFIPTDKINVTDYGMNMADFTALVHEVMRAGHEAAMMEPSGN